MLDTLHWCLPSFSFVLCLQCSENNMTEGSLDKPTLVLLELSSSGTHRSKSEFLFRKTDDHHVASGVKVTALHFKRKLAPGAPSLSQLILPFLKALMEVEISWSFRHKHYSQQSCSSEEFIPISYILGGQGSCVL